ncbi:MAG: NAD-dependent epimerase/dehydratase family protein [Paenisporosarcina sp.]
MKILVIGGTSFIGRHLVEESIKKGHEVVLFNRGKTNPGVFEGVRHIQGDRRKDAHLLENEKWDAVLDTCGYTPNDLSPILDSVMNHAKTYMFISTISVYDNYEKGRPNEDSSTFTHKIETDEVTGETYGPLKVMCEDLVNQAFGNKALIIRPCIVVGPNDPTDRFTYYVKKVTELGPIALPGGPESKRMVQWIDVRDMAKWIVNMVEEGKTGTYNAASDPITFDSFIDEIAPKPVEKGWISDKELEQHDLGVRRFPFWMPISESYPEGFFIVKNDKATAKGLTFRPLQETAEDTRKWAGDRELKAGPTKELEESLLKKK